MNVWLVGMPGSGKSAVGGRVAERLGMRFVDADGEIERRAGRSVAGIFAEAGEDGFRSLEAEVVADLAREDGLVVATGGGAVLALVNREAMRASGAVVLLEAPVASLAARVGGSGSRPVLEAVALETLAADRAAAYRAAAHHVVDASASIEEVVERVIEAVRP